METYCGSFKTNTENENLSVRKTKQNRLLFSLQFKKSTISIIIQMISLKSIKELKDFYLVETRTLCLIYIQNSDDFLIVLVEYLLNIVKEFKN